MLHSHHIISDSFPEKDHFAISVLLIEDTKDDQYLLQLYLKRVKNQSYKVFCADSLKDGLEILKQQEIQVVLLDLQLPDSNGLETYTSLHEQFPDLPVIIMTGASHEADLAIKALERGAQDYLEKDLMDVTILQKTIQYAIKRKDMIRGLEKAQRLGKLGFWEINPEDKSWQGVAHLQEMLGSEPNKPISTVEEFLETIQAEDRPQIKTFLNLALDTKKEFDAICRVKKLDEDGAFRWISLKGNPVVDSEGKVKYIEGTAQDISERRKLTEALQQKELAEKEAQIRRDFLAKTSHEIRTPLNPILLLTDMLLKSQLNQEQEKSIATIQTAAQTLLALVNDILDLSKIEAGKIEFTHEPFRIQDVLTHIYDLLEIHARRKRIRLDIKLDPTNFPKKVTGDMVRLTQILVNLVNNAIKFTFQGEVVVKASARHEEDGKCWVDFEVEDTGIGIPSDKLGEIFESFEQVKSSGSTKQGGTGLGLTIVRQLVQLQGGTIEVQSELGLGSVFKFSLPFQVKQEAKTESQISLQPSEPPQSKKDLNGASILLVEDDPLNQMVMEQLLEQWNAKVVIANNGEEGISLLREHFYDLILMDLQMPVKDGLTATLEIRSALPFPLNNVPIIGLTAQTMEGSEAKCFEVGMNDYVSKPIETEIFYRKLALYADKFLHKSEEVENRGQAAQQFKPPHSNVKNQTSIFSFMAEERYTDLSGLTSMYGGDLGLVKKTVKKIVDKVPEYLNDLNSFHQAGDFVRVGETIHKLKANIVGYMGISEFSEAGLDRMIEGIKKNSLPSERVEEFLQKFNHVVKTGIEELSQDLTTM
ncbi:MAG: response regulator [Bacteroidota bacterium]